MTKWKERVKNAHKCKIKYLASLVEECLIFFGSWLQFLIIFQICARIQHKNLWRLMSKKYTKLCYGITRKRVVIFVVTDTLHSRCDCLEQCVVISQSVSNSASAGIAASNLAHKCNLLMTNEMHNSYNQFLFHSFLSALHVSNESSRSSSGGRHNIPYHTVQSVQSCRRVQLLWSS